MIRSSKYPILISLNTILFLIASPFSIAENKTTLINEKHQESTDKVASVPLQKTNIELPRSGENGSPEVKITVGAPRGSDLDFELSIYIPKDHLIRSADYSLKWEITEVIHTPVKLILTDDSVDPLVDKIIANSSEAGIHIIDFQSLAIKLEPGKDYEWIMQACSTKACDTPARDLVARTYFKLGQ